MNSVSDGVVDRLEQFYDALPRSQAHAEEFGALVLFVQRGAGWPFYARPRPDADRPASAADVAAVRERQRELGLPEAFEWVHEKNPELLAVARSAGLTVLEAPLMVLGPAEVPDPAELCDVPVEVLDPDGPDLARRLAVHRAVADVGFGAPGTAAGSAGPAERDAAVAERMATVADAAERQSAEAAEVVESERDRMRAGERILAWVDTPADGVLAVGTGMRVGDVAELAGIATLPTARRRGLAAALTATLARRLRQSGADLVFLSAGSEDVARVYLRAGFHRIGTACIAEPAPVPPTG